MTTQQMHGRKSNSPVRDRKAAWGLVALLAITLVGALPLAAVHVNTSQGMTLAGAPLAIHGYDTVAYFTDGRPTIGKAALQVKHDGATYRFATAANMKKFQANPQRYAPQYGGFCAFGVSVGAKFDGDPHLFKVVNNKLYLNLNPDIQKNWQKDIAGNITKADGQWTKIRDKAPSDLK